MSDAAHELDQSDEFQVTPLELFFDLVFVFAITQVTSQVADDPPAVHARTAVDAPLRETPEGT